MKDLLTFLDDSKTAFNAVEEFEKELLQNDFIRLKESETYKVEHGKNYYIKRNDSTIMAFKTGDNLTPYFKIVASHTDCPSFKLKANPVMKDGKYIKLNTEIYGGPLLSPWFDRPLSIAGRLVIKKDGLIETKVFDLKKPFCTIPSLAIHMNREANSGYKNNPQVDMLPLVNLDEDFDFLKFLSEESHEEVIGYDLYLYAFEKAIKLNDDLFMSSHIDNLECAYTSFVSFLEANDNEALNIWVSFDNEEVGSLTRQGADSDFLEVNLRRIAKALNFEYESALAKSFLVSADNAHALHPNHYEKADPINRPLMNKGIVIKFNANQSYTSDFLSSAIFTEILKENNIPYQFFTNRSDARGGGTLGNISNGHVSIVSVDVGLAQLAMHSCVETAGLKDVEYMIKALKAFYSAKVRIPE